MLNIVRGILSPFVDWAYMLAIVFAMIVIPVVVANVIGWVVSKFNY